MMVLEFFSHKKLKNIKIPKVHSVQWETQCREGARCAVKNCSILTRFGLATTTCSWAKPESFARPVADVTKWNPLKKPHLKNDYKWVLIKTFEGCATHSAFCIPIPHGQMINKLAYSTFQVDLGRVKRSVGLGVENSNSRLIQDACLDRQFLRLG